MNRIRQLSGISSTKSSRMLTEISSVNELDTYYSYDEPIDIRGTAKGPGKGTTGKGPGSGTMGTGTGQLGTGTLPGKGQTNRSGNGTSLGSKPNYVRGTYDGFDDEEDERDYKRALDLEPGQKAGRWTKLPPLPASVP